MNDFDIVDAQEAKTPAKLVPKYDNEFDAADAAAGVPPGFQSGAKSSVGQHRQSILDHAAQVGYSGLSDAEKQEFDTVFPKLRHEGKGFSLDYVHALMDQQAGIPQDAPMDIAPTTPSQLWQTTRQIMAVPAAAVTTGADWLGSKVENFYNGIGNANAKPYEPSDFSENYASASRGEGFGGFLADPLNLYASVIPGIRSTAVADKLAGMGSVGAKAAQAIEQSPAVAQALMSGLHGGAIGTAASMVDPLQQSTADAGASGAVDGLRNFAVQAVASGVLGGLGQKLKESAISNFPGDEYAARAAMRGMKATHQYEVPYADRESVLEGVTKTSLFPTRQKWFDYAQGLTDHSSKDYRRVDKIFDEAIQEMPLAGTMNIDEVRQALKNRLLEETTSPAFLTPAQRERGITGHLASASGLDEAAIDRFLDEKLSGVFHSAAQNAAANPGHAKLGNAIFNQFAPIFNHESPESQHALLNLLATERRIPVSDASRILQGFNEDISGLHAKNPTLQAKFAQIAHEGMHHDVLGGEGKRISALNWDKSGPTYNEKLLPETRANYALGSKLKKIISKQAEGGHSMRLALPVPFLGEVLPNTYMKVGSSYGTTGLKYKLGKLAQDMWVQQRIGDAANMGYSGIAAALLNKSQKDTTGAK